MLIIMSLFSINIRESTLLAHNLLFYIALLVSLGLDHFPGLAPFDGHGGHGHVGHGHGGQGHGGHGQGKHEHGGHGHGHIMDVLLNHDQRTYLLHL